MQRRKKRGSHHFCCLLIPRVCIIRHNYIYIGGHRVGFPLLRQTGIHLRLAYCRGIARESFRIHANASLGGGGDCRIPFHDGTDTCNESVCKFAQNIMVLLIVLLYTTCSQNNFLTCNYAKYYAHRLITLWKDVPLVWMSMHVS